MEPSTGEGELGEVRLSGVSPSTIPSYNESHGHSITHPHSEVGPASVHLAALSLALSLSSSSFLHLGPQSRGGLLTLSSFGGLRGGLLPSLLGDPLLFAMGLLSLSLSFLSLSLSLLGLRLLPRGE